MFGELVAAMTGAVAAGACFVGVYSGGAWLAERLAREVPGDHPVGFLDVSFYRDDLARAGLKATVRRTELPFAIEGADVVLIDDVLYTGRSIRAAINVLFDYGRPRSVELAVLADRGGRELPIAADYCGGEVIVPVDQLLELERDEAGQFRFRCVPRRR
ncbi:MAG: bifunctional pyr operon transcriptional regulator/uracil phosphoribosyltransferase PyrR [Casimicrobiaceae bacterium]|nr:bifunctional pyr operon transcriptional regulator/uracil phosphoribosyltransferase PyrR [Casimicrobiaceae bacterium]MCX8099063.1 bifunctional pyr operon transcriptional regulator/uracil phosphoribosyltransferase PyrR [Casimicrobiaceae bacterium]MDW8312572.1 bifunctional pyr operon transcriptional regulator/uracil phosphoribosyltransferase PyrR [Burkholderiales bacterium]